MGRAVARCGSALFLGMLLALAVPPAGAGLSPGPVAACEAVPLLLTAQPFAGPEAWVEPTRASAVAQDEDAAEQQRALPDARVPLGPGRWLEVQGLHAACAAASATLWGDDAPTRVASGEASATRVALTGNLGTLLEVQGLRFAALVLADPEAPMRLDLECGVVQPLDPLREPSVACPAGAVPGLPPGARVVLDDRWGPVPMPDGTVASGGAAMHLELPGPDGPLHAYLAAVRVTVRQGA